MNILFRLLKFVLGKFGFPALLIASGWYGGAKYDAPDFMIETIDAAIIKIHSWAAPLLGEGTDYVAGTAEDFVADFDWDEARAEVGEQISNAGEAIASLAENTAEEPSGENAAQDAQENAQPSEASPTPPTRPAPTKTPTTSNASAMSITICPTTVRNAPRSKNGVVGPGDKTVKYKGVKLLLMPATKSCLSSGYGPRGSSGKLHKGVDYYTKQNGDVLAAGDGVVVESVSRSDYGNMLVVDHGNGVYTRYAHLRRFGSGIHKGVSVTKGQRLGPIGNTGASSIIHLHYEVLTGDINTNAGSFGLKPVDPFSL